MKARMKAALSLLSVMFMLISVPVMASEKPEMYLQAEYVKDSDKEIQVECKIKNGDSVSNGKIRVLYDADKAELKSSGAGDALEGTMCEINDCLKGNKEAGELVAAFASSEKIKKEGSILSMKFQVKDGVKDGDKISFTLKPEKLAGESGDFETKEIIMEFEAGKEKTQIGNPESGNAGNGGSIDTEENKDDGKNKESDTDKKPDQQKVDKKKSNVKTGDETETGKYIVLGAGAGIIVLAGAVAAIKKKKVD